MLNHVRQMGGKEESTVLGTGLKDTGTEGSLNQRCFRPRRWIMTTRSSQHPRRQFTAY